MANNNDKNKNKNLYYLNELSDYKIASEDPDVRGWQVKDADNRVIGKVDNLLVNKSSERVVYLDVEVDSSIIEANHDPYGSPADADVHEFINKEGENHIIIPIGLVNVNNDPDYVFTDRINHQTFAETKRIQPGSPINREYEVVVLDSYGRNRDDYDRNRDKAYSDDRDTSHRDKDRDRNYRDDDSKKRGLSDDDRASNEVHGTVERRTVRDDDDSLSDRRKDRDYDRDDDRRDRDNDSRAGRDSGRIPDDDSFYERREFDGSNYRRRR